MYRRNKHSLKKILLSLIRILNITVKLYRCFLYLLENLNPVINYNELFLSAIYVFFVPPKFFLLF